jgi:hypothetical protein
VSGDRNGGSERGDVLLGWLTKVVVGIAVVGLVGFDAISIEAGRLSASDEANSAAEAANVAWDTGRVHPAVQQLYDAAAAVAEEHGDFIPPRSFSVDSVGNVRLTLVHHISTIAAHHIGPLRHLTVVRAQGTATTPTP